MVFRIGSTKVSKDMPNFSVPVGDSSNLARVAWKVVLYLTLAGAAKNGKWSSV
jgi:hypothetical protein